MNIYDFDNTIYNGDSCRDLVLFGLKKYPNFTIKSLIKAKKLNKDYKNNKIPFERVKEELLSFIFKINNYPKFINEFVNTHIKKIKPWYIARKSENDIIVSASYDLWIKKFAKILGIKHVIATKVDSKGKIIGKNCKREEKVKRLKSEYKNCVFETSYSDSESDIPILEIAKKAFVVEGNKIYNYNRSYNFKNKK